MDTLTTAQSTQLGAVLQQQRADVLHRIRERLHGSSDPAALAVASHLSESDDRAEADQQNDTDLALIDHEVEALRDIDRALARLASGKAGVCVVCSEAIPIERLVASPTAQTCLSCQQAAEKRQVRAAHGAGYKDGI